MRECKSEEERERDITFNDGRCAACNKSRGPMMQLRSHRDEAVTYMYIHTRDTSLQIRDISLSMDFAKHTVQQRGH